MATDNFLPQSVAEAPGLVSTVFGIGNTEVAWTNPSSSIDEDGNAATCTYNGTTQVPRCLLFSNLLAESDGSPIATRINAGSTITAIYADVKASIDAGSGQSIRVRLYSANTLAVVGTAGFVAPAPTSAVSTWYSVTNGTIFGGSAALVDVRGTAFGFYSTVYGDTVSRTVSMEAVRLVITWTPGTSTARPRRQNIRLKDGRIAAVRARVR